MCVPVYIDGRSLHKWLEQLKYFLLQISHRAAIVVSIQREILPLLRDNLLLSFPLQLVLFHPFVFVNPVHKLPHTGDWLANQGFSQAMLGWEAAFKSADSDIIKVTVHLIVHFSIYVRVCL